MSNIPDATIEFDSTSDTKTDANASKEQHRVIIPSRVVPYLKQADLRFPSQTPTAQFFAQSSTQNADACGDDTPPPRVLLPAADVCKDICARFLLIYESCIEHPFVTDTFKECQLVLEQLHSKLDRLQRLKPTIDNMLKAAEEHQRAGLKAAEDHRRAGLEQNLMHEVNAEPSQQ